ncbi:MAG: RsmB/NOP family class I SAM-dependent RNA methyltransferase [Candidatus Dojkabacteria bacterium]|jgi:16S rRNA (cytosine1407-C5)-methyltransferase|nr:RsmB/NOP family class I SAM-dependent RNA methyltransferase [Candidatus Dojkabacteria bacterium]MDD2270479.1 RsmB/NOP family class I SAM-dependent RNA methyltransferase [Candidatus Dojkabacteria bacterium]
MKKRRLRSNYKKNRNKSQEKKYYTKEDIFLSRIASILQISKGEVKHLFFQRARTTIRLNNLVDNPKDIYKVLTKTRGWELQEIKNLKDTYFVNNKDKSEVGESEEYEDGKFYIQDLSSILSIYILDPQPDEDILDVAAAPGSKTTLISSLTDNKARVVANDVDEHRIMKLLNVLRQFGSKYVEVTKEDGKVLGNIYPNHFDRVILDAPCSGEGRVYFGGKKSLRFWSIKMVNAMVKIQKGLIESAFKSLKVGGTLIYSTCTLEPDENEGVITHLLNKYSDARIEDIEFVNTLEPLLKDKIKGGITKWSGNTYHQEVAKSIRIVPSPEMMGFYIAKITKV